MRMQVSEFARVVLVVATLTIVGSAGPADCAAQERPVVTIGVLTDGPLVRFGGLLDLIERETSILLESRYDMLMGAETRSEGDHTLEGTRAALERLLARQDVDVVVAVGAIAAHVAAEHQALTKPVIAPFVLDPSLQGVPRAGAASGVSNFVYLTRPENRDIAMLAEMVDFDRLAVLTSATALDALPEISGRIETALAEAGATAIVVPVGSDASAALAAVEAADADAVYVLPLAQMSSTAFGQLVDGLIRLELPSMSWFGEPEVRQGILLGRRPESFLFQIARLTALNINQILRGEEPGSLRVMYVPQEHVMVNMRTARAVGAYPSWSMLSDAQLIDDVPEVETAALSLDSVVREALEQNQDLASFNQAVLAAAEDVKLATSRLLPQVGLDFTGSVIDEDRADASFGILPQRLLSGTVGLSQVVYSDRAWADRAVQQSLLRAEEEDYASLQQDVSFEAADAYVTIFRRKTDDRIQRENLTFTRTNLDLAEIRRQTGAATPGEVLRWQAQVSRDRQGVVGAVAATNIAETRLKRLLHRPLDRPMTMPESDLEDPVVEWAQVELIRFLENPQSFELFEEFMVAEAQATAPELMALDALVSGQQRALTAVKRSYWLPEFFLGADVTNWLATGGAGSDFSPGDLAPGLQPGEPQDAWRWSVGLSARYLIFGGGSRPALRRQAQQNLSVLEYQRTAAAERVEESMRVAMELLLSSRVRLALARQAAEAARGNFELVRTAYAGGVTGILSLLDAQNTALFADLDAASALYDFITDFLFVQRSAGQIDLFLDETKREAFIERLRAFFQVRGVG